MNLKLIRELKNNQSEINRLKTRQDTIYNDTELRSAISQLVSRVATIETAINGLNIPDETTIITPKWHSTKITGDVAVTDVAGATEIVSLSVGASGGQLLLLLEIGAIVASANNTAGQLDFKIDGSIVDSLTFSLRNQEVFSFDDFATFEAIKAGAHTFSVDLTTTTASRTLTVLGSEVATFLLLNDAGIVK